MSRRWFSLFVLVWWEFDTPGSTWLVCWPPKYTLNGLLQRGFSCWNEIILNTCMIFNLRDLAAHMAMDQSTKQHWFFKDSTPGVKVQGCWAESARSPSTNTAGPKSNLRNFDSYRASSLMYIRSSHLHLRFSAPVLSIFHSVYQLEDHPKQTSYLISASDKRSISHRAHPLRQAQSQSQTHTRHRPLSPELQFPIQKPIKHPSSSIYTANLALNSNARINR